MYWKVVPIYILTNSGDLIIRKLIDISILIFDFQIQSKNLLFEIDLFSSDLLIFFQKILNQKYTIIRQIIFMTFALNIIRFWQKLMTLKEFLLSTSSNTKTSFEMNGYHLLFL